MIASLLALALAVMPPTQSVETEHFRIVHTERSAAAAKALAEEIEHSREIVRSHLGRDWPGHTEVRLGADRTELEALSPEPGPLPPWSEALAWPALDVVLVDAHSLVKADGQATLRHEIVHVALGRLASGWPRWFQEGLAQQATQEHRFDFRQYETLSRAVTQERVFPLETLANGFPDRPDDVAIAYAQSSAFVGFLFERHGAEGFGRLVDALATGIPFEQAFARAFKSTIWVEEQAWRTQLPGRFPAWVAFVLSDALWGALALLMVLAWWRRRREVLALRAEQAAQEARDDEALAAAGLAVDPYWMQLEPQEPPPTAAPEPEPENGSGPGASGPGPLLH